MTSLLRYVLDENVPAPLWHAVQQHNAARVYPIDVVCVGDPPDLPLGTPDPDILLWAEREGRIIVSLDEGTLPGHLAMLLQAGGHSPGVLLIRPSASLAEVREYLVEAAYAASPNEFENGITYIP